ncbi:MAG: APC family permease [Gammaproteobacteria bacterium]
MTISSRHTIGAFSIAMMTVTSVDSIRNLPAIALFGSSLIFFFIIAAVCFLLPSAMVSAELATGWSKTGGIYIWVKEAFGKKAGLLAIWFQWIENVIWYPTLLSFIAGSIAYIFSPSLAANKYYLMSVIVATFWIVSLLNLRGIKLSARFSSLCGIFGLMLPMSMVIVLGIIWVILGKPLQVHFNLAAMAPNFHNPSILVSLTAIVLCFCGMEIATVHSQHVTNPARDYPLALKFSVIFIMITMLLGALAIAVTVSSSQLSLVSGISQALQMYLNAYHLGWVTPIIMLLVLFGILGSLSPWIIAPRRGMQIALNDLQLFPTLIKENRFLVPTPLIIYQAIIVTLLAGVFLLLPSVNASYWILTAMTAQLYMGMYILMFAAAIALRYRRPEVVRAYRIPGGKPGIWIVAGAGFMISIITIIIGFFPPDGINIGSIWHYEAIMFTGLFLMSIPPFIILAWHARKQAAALAAIPTIEN